MTPISYLAHLAPRTPHTSPLALLQPSRSRLSHRIPYYRSLRPLIFLLSALTDVPMPPPRGSYIQRYTGIFPVAVVLALVAYTYFAYVVRLCIPLIQTGAIGQAIVYLVVYHVILALFLLCYTIVLAHNPGGVERDSLPAYLKTQSQAFAFADSAALLASDPLIQIDSSDNLKKDPPASQLNEASVSSLPRLHLTSAPPVGSTSVTNYHPLTATRNGRLRWCNQCQIVKPDRAHHCNVCGVCVLKMDHHCPWVNGCVGFRNYRYFVQFVAYSALLSLFMAVSALAAYVGHGMQDTFDYNVLAQIIITAVFAFVLVPFSGAHLGLTFVNRTTIENASWRSWRLARDGWPPRRSRKRTRDSAEVHPGDVEAASGEPMTWTAKGETLTAGGQNVFDFGWSKNWSQVMGEKWWQWFVPFGKVPGNGLVFPVNPAVYAGYRNEIVEAKERTRDVAHVEQPER